MKILIIIPTLNEKNNILNLYKNIQKLDLKLDILFIDDNSKDGTRVEILKLRKKDKCIKYIFRPKKLGIGSAHKDGLKYAYKKKYKKIITMDADSTHNPKYIKSLLKYSNKFDLVSTNRFINKSSLKDWPFHRRFLTNVRYYLINILLDMKYDSSGAFRCYSTSKIKINEILKAQNDGYSFFWESLFLFHKNHHLIKEISINLPYRKVGSSKMTIKDILNSLLYLLKYFLKNLFIK